MIPDITFDNQNSTTVGGKIIELGQTFNLGKANPDVERYSGEIIYIDNRAPIPGPHHKKKK